MPDRKTLKRAAEDKREGKAPSTQAGEFVREEMEHVREGKHGARSAKQAIAIGLSKARRAGVALEPPAEGQASAQTRRSAKLANAAAARKRGTISSRRSRAASNALKREGGSAASPVALSRHAKAVAKKRGPAARSAAARKAARTRSGKG
ncbi:MAG TPA: DNA-binding protein [Casimicrobiaceae bacterium]|jgi:hypothetical protein